MKASVEWLNEYADIDVSAKELGDILILIINFSYYFYAFLY